MSADAEVLGGAAQHQWETMYVLQSPTKHPTLLWIKDEDVFELTDEFRRSNHCFHVGCRTEILSGAKVDQLELLCTVVLQNNVLRLR